ncbi:MAG: Universal stress protein family [Nitrospira sp.]|jgi:nucleotide-binding universal stress UspA family protein|nr:MAG: Universal stress protein family [Nitrospira sp.]
MTTPLTTRILFATDFSDDAVRAQEYAMYLATAWDAKVDVLHVIEAPVWLNADAATVAVVEQARKDAAQRLEQIHDQMVRSGISAAVRQVVGNPAEEVALAARDNGADLLVLGVQGRTNLLYGLIGSTVERVVKDGPCPVLAVPGMRDEVGRPIDAHPYVPIRNILVAVDFSSPSLNAAEYAIQLANSLGCKLTLMHVLEPLCYDLDCGLGLIEQETRKRDHWNRQLSELKDLIISFGLPAEVEISGGFPSDAILASTLRHRSDLVVMGTHGRRGVSGRRFGSVAEAVLRRATCPVVTVKQPKFAPGHRRVVPQQMGAMETKGAEQ